MKRERSYDMGVLTRGALEMLNGRRKLRKETGKDAGNGIFVIEARFSSHARAKSY